MLKPFVKHLDEKTCNCILFLLNTLYWNVLILIIKIASNYSRTRTILNMLEGHFIQYNLDLLVFI